MFAHRAIPIVLAAVLIDTIGFGIVMPVFPHLITTLGRVDLEAATRIAGWLMVVPAAAQFFAGPILGNLGDRYGRRPVLLSCMLAFGFDYALMAWAPSLGWLFLGRLVAGVTGAVYGPASAVLADITPPEERSAAFGWIGGAFGLGFIIGPAIGGLLSGLGDRAPFLVACGLALLNAVSMALLLPETLPPGHRRRFRLADAHVVSAFRPLFHAGNATPLLIAMFLYAVASQVYPATWPFWASIQLKWDATAIGWSLAFVGASMMLVQGVLTGPVIRRLGEVRALRIGLTADVLAFFLFVFVTRGWHAYALFVLSAVAGLSFPAMNGLLSRLVDPTRQGALQGGIGAMGSIAAILGPLILSNALAYGAERGFAGAAFLLSGLFAATALLLLRRVLRQPLVPPSDTIPSSPGQAGDGT